MRSETGMELATAAVHVRWMLRRDMAAVLDIERESFEFPWFEEDFIRCLRQRNCIALVAELGERVVGFMFYELFPRTIHLMDLAVAPEFRRRGVGRKLVAKLADKLDSARRVRLSAEVIETNLAAQLFFRTCGFRAVGVARDYYDQVTRDAYRMELRVASNEKREGNADER